MIFLFFAIHFFKEDGYQIRLVHSDDYLRSAHMMPKFAIQDYPELFDLDYNKKYLGFRIMPRSLSKKCLTLTKLNDYFHDEERIRGNAIQNMKDITSLQNRWVHLQYGIDFKDCRSDFTESDQIFHFEKNHRGIRIKGKELCLTVLPSGYLLLKVCNTYYDDVQRFIFYQNKEMIKSLDQIEPDLESNKNETNDYNRSIIPDRYNPKNTEK